MSRSLVIACKATLFVLSALSLGGCFVRSNPQPAYYSQPTYYNNRPAYYRAQPVYQQPVYAAPAPVVYVR